mmetsp:Transcript_25920/g.51974  ORF Transcript_25920/g.51974 Transcript_25920/m.51974 type:complete len:100 (-) Transcript_25920:154-453(-)
MCAGDRLLYSHFPLKQKNNDTKSNNNPKWSLFNSLSNTHTFKSMLVLPPFVVHFIIALNRKETFFFHSLTHSCTFHTHIHSIFTQQYVLYYDKAFHSAK